MLRHCLGVGLAPDLHHLIIAIIDCYEIKIETPSHLVAKASMWSQYKHANTAKVFIAMCTQGITTFISPAWGGRVSNKFLTVNSGFFNKLLSGDCILAVRAFDIAKVVARMQATLHIPSFTRGCAQLAPVDIENTRTVQNCKTLPQFSRRGLSSDHLHCLLVLFVKSFKLLFMIIIIAASTS